LIKGAKLQNKSVFQTSIPKNFPKITAIYKECRFLAFPFQNLLFAFLGRSIDFYGGSTGNL